MSDELEIHGAYDEDFYDIALNELKSGQFSESLWSKALAKSEFDEIKAKGVYVELRVEQLKSDVLLEEKMTEQKEEFIQINKEIEEKKIDWTITNIMSNPLFMIQTLIISSAAGFYKESWWAFIIVILAMITIMAIPFISNFVGYALAGLFGYAGYYIGNDLWGQTGGYWAGGITFLIIFGANSELLDKTKKLMTYTKMSKTI